MQPRSIYFSLRWEFLTLCTGNVRSLVPEFVDKLGTSLGGYCAEPIVPVVKDRYDDDLNPREALNLTVFVSSSNSNEEIEAQVKKVAHECLAVVVGEVEMRE